MTHGCIITAGFSFYAPDKWKRLQNSIKLDQLVSIEAFRIHSENTCHMDWTEISFSLVTLASSDKGDPQPRLEI